MNKYSLFKGNKTGCSEQCGKEDWCLSFDLCQKEPAKSDDTYCHLKNVTASDYTKFSKTNKKGSYYYQCEYNDQNVTVKSDEATFIVGESKKNVLTQCSKQNNGQLYCKS